MSISLLTKFNINLSSKLCSLSREERNYFNKRLMDVLNDKYSCFVYGGVNRKEYANPPKEKIEKIKLNLYQEMFEDIIPPPKILVELTNSNN